MCFKRKISRRKFIKASFLAGSAAAIDWTGLNALASEKKDKTRSQNLSHTLADAIEAGNGNIRYNTQVDEIVFSKNNRIKGVTDSDDHFYPARAVVANCAVPAVFNKMVPQNRVPALYKKKLTQYNPSVSSFVVWLGLNKPLDRINNYEIDIVQDNSNTAGLFSKTDLALSNFGVTIYDNLFKGYSYPGTSTISIICLSDYKQWKQFEEEYFTGNKQAYNKEKTRIAKAFIEKLEQVLIPGLKNMIEVMEIGTPLTNNYYTGNTDGAIYGFDTDLGHLETRAPVQGLYLAGAWANGGGYSPVMMSGRDAAKCVLQDFSA